MWRRTTRHAPTSRLEQVLPGAQQVETHSVIVDAPTEFVWQSLATLTADDLPGARALMWVRRGGGGVDGLGRRPLLESGPVPAQIVEAPYYAAGVKAHRPWRALDGPAVALDTVDTCGPGWVLTGTEFELEERDDGRTLLTTRTRCHSTSADARRRMRAYWLLVGPFSALIRREMLAATARRARELAA